GRLGGLDILVNSAGGVLGLHGPFARLDSTGIGRLVELNLLGALLMTRAALDWMIPQGRGRVVTISSEGAKMSTPGTCVYNACKAGLLGFNRNLSQELRGTGVTTVAVCPGPMVGRVQFERLASGEQTAIRTLMDDVWQHLAADRFCLP